MVKDDRQKNLEILFVGIMLVAASGILFHLDIGWIYSLAYGGINLLGLVIMVRGLLYLEKYSNKFAIAKKLVIVAIIALGASIILIGFGTKNVPISYGYLATCLCVMGLILTMSGTYTAIVACGEVADSMGQTEHKKNCLRTGKFFLGAISLCIAIIIVIIFFAKFLGDIKLVMTLGVIVLFACGYLLMGLRARETYKLIGNNIPETTATTEKKEGKTLQETT